jgi:hypothetical protein
MTRYLLLSAFAAIAFAPDRAHSAPGVPYRTLLSAHIFSFGGVGITGKRTPEENAYDALMRQRDREEQLRSLLVEARTPAGKLYALYGLRQLRVRDYWDVAMPYRRNHEPVDTAFACLVGRADVAEMVRYADHAFAVK